MKSILPSAAVKSAIAFKIILMIFLLGILVIFAHHLVDEIPKLEKFLRAQGAWAPILFALTFCMLPLVLVPTDPLCLVAGALFGLGMGFVLAGIGMLGSAVLMFGISRYLAQAPIKKLLTRYPKFQRFNYVVEGGGMKVLFLLRLAPIPFGPLSYFLGITKISFRQYFWSIFGTFGTVFVGVYYGSVAKHLTKLVGKTESFSWLHDIGLLLGFLISLVVLVAITHYARRNLEQYAEASSLKAKVPIDE